MKTSSALIVSSIILSIAIIFSANEISSKMYPPSNFPSSLAVTNYEGDKNMNDAISSKDFISIFEAAAYLRMDQSKLEELIRNGKLNGTYTSFPGNGGTNYIFSTSKLSEWMKKTIENGENLR